jgi:NADPH-dependent ferric siderophore reductase
MKKPNFFQSALLGLFARDVAVVSVEAIGARFRLFTVAGDGLKDVDWRPGWKSKLDVETFTLRVYTPIRWDRDRGEVQYLAYVHGNGPGSLWAEMLNPGDVFKLAGPRHSLDFSNIARPAIFFGDETSIGVAASFGATVSGFKGISFLFEADSTAEAGQALTRLGLGRVQIVERQSNDAHHGAVEAALAALMEKERPASFILTGKAGSIQHLNRALRQRGVSSAQLMVKAYWSPGKVALD